MDTVFTFNNIPSNFRVPGFYFELDPSKANSGTYIPKLLVLGQMLTTGGNAGAAAPETMYRLTAASEGDVLFGRGSMISEMINIVFLGNPEQEVWACAQADVDVGSGGVKATATATFAGTMTDNGLFIADIAGFEIRIGVLNGDTSATIVAALAAAITANEALPLTAAVGGAPEQLVFTAKHNGEVPNDLIVNIEYAGTTAAGVTVNANGSYQLAGGATNPGLVNTFAAMGDEWYRWIAMPYTDTANLTALKTELDERFGPVQAIGARAFTAYRGTNGQAAAFGDTLNSEHITCMGTSLAAQPSYIWSAANAVAAGNSLAKDSSRPLRTLPLIGIVAPKKQNIFTKIQQNLLLFDGISTFDVASDGTVMISKQITTRQETALGLPDDSMLSINAPEQYEDYRFDQKILFAPHVRDKLSEDSPNLPAGQAIMTPKKAEILLKGWYVDVQIGLRGRCERAEDFKPLVIKNGSRLEIIDNPKFADGFEQVYIRSEKSN